MKLSFTTLGCPDWDLQLIIGRAAEYGFDAIDFRGLNGELQLYKLPEFAEFARSTKEAIKDAGLTVSCFSSSVKAFSAGDLDANIEEIRSYAKLCSLFETPYIRVFGGGIGSVSRHEAVAAMVAHLDILGTIAKEYGVKLLLETHDDWTSCTDVKAVMEQLDPDAIGVLWDLHHPYRVLGESPEETLAALGPWIHYTHVKDSRLTPDGKRPFQYCRTGEGSIPLAEMIGLLRSRGYDGYYTLEWEKKWHPDLEDASIVFPHYVHYMRQLTE
ncbi:sugar phosphate isomerase/epimerase family protein [Paenibacillus sp. GD4]|jgi:sugar phosphate isomerase/epimerase|uniref:sugar phosphate isomerase/epimerase family protein n=1 Tax=Paenibacillus sp. GD4 TaxID=3068890 RepID=UPI002796941C|nr:sugar phosphate isomerase/epimerase family protein [Paenibacillus sp. GD4]MDQ1913913.1 sugar phosphate isomerase/epimerase family protein [Paenibacillus sp. GD4]